MTTGVATDVVRALLVVERLGDTDRLGWWRSHSVGDTAEYVLPDPFPSTWLATGVEFAMESARSRHEQLLDIDYYEMTTLRENGIGGAAASDVRVRFEELAGGTVCGVTVKSSSTPVWTKQKGQEESFYVRLNNSTCPLGPREAFDFISQHFR